MSDFTRKNYGGFPLCYEKEFYDDEFDEDYYDDSNEFIPRIKGTKLETGIAFLGSNYFPLLTSRVSDGKRKYYLFDFIKVWQANDDTYAFEYDEDGFPFMNKLQTILQEYTFREEVANPKVSIIVPVYNTSEYLERCMLSLIQQTLKEIEIICVDDGSQDNSYSILSEFAKYDSRIKLIKQEHKLQGAARNNGTLNAKGEYVGFVDSDDWVDLDYFEKLYNAAKKYNSDIALATNVRIGNGKTKKRLNITEEKLVTTLQEKIDIGNQAKNPCPTNKIYRREMLKNNNITWPEGVYCEDKLFTIQALFYSNGIVAVPNCYYYYFRNPDSTVFASKNKNDKKHIEDKINAQKSVLKFIREFNLKIRDKDFWAIKKDYNFLGIGVYRIKESIKCEKHLLFKYIPIYYRRNISE